jgi:uncharacterized membrane protein
MVRVYLRRIWERLRTSYWFVPLVMAVLAVLLSHLMLWIDAQISNETLSGYKVIFNQDTEQARVTLTNLAGTLLSTAGVVFTLLTLPLSLAASQFGSRLLRLYLRDRTTQGVLGVFVATFVYCLAVVLAIPPADYEPDAPQLTATVGLLLSLIAFASLLVLIHHIATLLQAPNVAAAAGAELRHVMSVSISPSRHQPVTEHPAGAGTDPPSLPALVEREGCPIYAGGTGYIEQVDPDLAIPLANRRNLVIRLVRKPGDFVQAGDRIALAWPPQDVDEEVIGQIQACYRLGNARIPTQDVEYAINQLVEMAVRAMSAAINDPYTAMTCLDHLGAGLALCAGRNGYQPYLYDSENRLRVIVDPPTLGGLLDGAFNMIRHASRDNADVLLRLLDAIERVAAKSSTADQRAELLGQVRLVEAESQAGSSIDWDRERVSCRCAELAAKLSDG